MGEFVLPMLSTESDRLGMVGDFGPATLFMEALLASANQATIKQCVLICDRERLGGAYLTVGCVLRNALMHVDHTPTANCRAGANGLVASIDPADLAVVAGCIERAIAAVEAESDSLDYLTPRGIEAVFGGVERARFVSPYALHLNGPTITARRFLIYTGSQPRVPNISGLTTVPSSQGAIVELRRLPSRLAIRRYRFW